MPLIATTLRNLMDTEYAAVNATYAADTANRELIKTKLLHALAKAIADHTNPELAGAGGVTIRKDGGADVGPRSRINVIQGANMTLTVVDDPDDDEVDVTFAASAATAAPHAADHASGGPDPVTLAQSQVTNLTTDLAAKVPTTRTLTGSGAVKIAGGNTPVDLSADRTVTVDTATTGAVGVVQLATDGEAAAGKAVQANDSRLSAGSVTASVVFHRAMIINAMRIG